jgi:tetratricopeptide (TPR) repeat protein
MDLWTIIGGLALIIGIVAGIVQVLDYLEKRRAKKTRLVPAEVATPSPPTPAIPCTLPPRGEFIGREKEKARVWEALSSRWPLTCIDGIGGIGKTALALEVTGECLRASKGEVPPNGIPIFDGFIWTTAKDRELTLNDVLDAIARTLDYPGIAQQPLKEKQESVRKLLQTKPYLLIVDNFETVKDDAVRDFLLRLPEPSKALITSREQKLRQAWAVSLKGLEQEEALTLIRSEGRRLGLASVEKAEERVLLHLYQATGGAPLAIKWAVGQIKQKGQSLDTVLAALHKAKGDIFEEVFARSWSLLSEEARRILMIMPIFAASASRDAIEATSDVHHFALDKGLGQLVEMWLVEATDELDAAKRRYSIHPLTRAFAGARLGENEKWERGARLKAAKHFLSLAQQNDGWDNRDGFPWFELELTNILASLDWCYNVGEWHIVVELMKTLTYFMGNRGYWQERIKYGHIAAKSAKYLGSDESVAWLNLRVGWVYLKQGDYEKAEACVKTAEALTKKAENKTLVRLAFSLLGGIARGRGEVSKARELAEKALEAARASAYKRGINRAYCDLGHLALQQGDDVEAERLYREALRGFEKEGSEEGIASRHIDLGNATFSQDRLDEAYEHYKVGLALNQRIGRQDNIACAQYGLARVGERAGDFSSALELAHSAQEIFERLGMRKEVEETQALVVRLEEKLSADR